MQDYDFKDAVVVTNHALCFVCEEHYPQSLKPWRPPHRCAFSLCSQCVRNEIGMSQKYLEMMKLAVDEDEDELIETEEEEFNEGTDSSDAEYDDEDYNEEEDEVES